MLIWSIRLCFRWRFLFKLKKTYNNIFSIYYRLSEFRPYNWFFNRDREKTVKLLPSSSKSVYQIVALALEEGRRSEMCYVWKLESWSHGALASQTALSLSLPTPAGSWDQLQQLTQAHPVILQQGECWTHSCYCGLAWLLCWLDWLICNLKWGLCCFCSGGVSWGFNKWIMFLRVLY